MNPVLAELIKTEKFKDYLERIKNTNAPIAILASWRRCRTNSFMYRNRIKKTNMSYNL